MQSMQAYITFGWFERFLHEHGIASSTAGWMVALLSALGIPTSIVAPNVPVRHHRLLMNVLALCFVGRLHRPRRRPGRRRVGVDGAERYRQRHVPAGPHHDRAAVALAADHRGAVGVRAGDRLHRCRHRTAVVRRAVRCDRVVGAAADVAVGVVGVGVDRRAAGLCAPLRRRRDRRFGPDRGISGATPDRDARSARMPSTPIAVPRTSEASVSSRCTTKKAVMPSCHERGSFQMLCRKVGQMSQLHTPKATRNQATRFETITALLLADVLVPDLRVRGHELASSCAQSGSSSTITSTPFSASQSCPP